MKSRYTAYLTLCCLFAAGCNKPCPPPVVVASPTATPTPITKEVERAVCAPNGLYLIDATSVNMKELALHDGCRVIIAPGLQSVNLTVGILTLHGNSTFDLTPNVPPLVKGPTPGTPGQIHNDPPTQKGWDGSGGAHGISGENGVTLNLVITTLNHADGALWVKTDGTPGGPGSNGGNGGQGSDIKRETLNCYNGGDGGKGGPGGNGGNGGSTAKITVTSNPPTPPPTQALGFAPSSRPSVANDKGHVVTSGAPGKGGTGGDAGQGGPGGIGGGCRPPASGADPGRPGPPGTPGTRGQDGKFVP